MDYILTAYRDLIGTIALINIESKKKSSVHIYPLFRDICLMLYQIHKDIFNNSQNLLPEIKYIRHKVKLYKKKNNINTYNRIINTAIYQFGDDIDNIGFYLEDNKTMGSTVYSTYIFLDTEVIGRNPKETSNNALEFAKVIGDLTLTTIFLLQTNYSSILPKKITLPEYGFSELDSYTEKDTYYTNIYNGEFDNVMMTRLLLSIQEISTSIWLYEIFKETKEDSLEKYILLRLLSIKADEVLDNIKNLRSFLFNDFEKMDNIHDKKLSKIIDKVDLEMGNEIRTLRNMLHYNKVGKNFLTYLQEQQSVDPEYISNTVSYIINEFMNPLHVIISNTLKVDQTRSMSIIEKIGRRASSILQGKDFKNTNNNY